MKQKCKYCGDYLVLAGAKPIYKGGKHIGDNYYFECKKGHYWEETKIFKERSKKWKTQQK